MKFTPSTTYTILSNAAAKEIEWKVYIKSTTAINDNINTGTWIDVTSYVDSVPDIASSVEYETGQFTADSISLTGTSIAFWSASLTNIDTAGTYYECKVTANLKSGTSTTGEILVYNGFVNPDTLTYSELDDAVSFDVLTSQDVATKLIGENVSSQYIDSHHNRGVQLPNLPFAFVTSSNVSGYPLQIGKHTIRMETSSSKYFIQLDDGRLNEVSDSKVMTLGDAEEASIDTQRVQVYVTTGSLRGTFMPYFTSSVAQDIVIISQSSEYPRTIDNNVGVKYALSRIAYLMGIQYASQSFGNLTLNTYDSRIIPSYIDIPPNDGTTFGYKWALTTSGSDLLVGVGDKVYARRMSTDAYALICTASTAGRQIVRLWYNARNNDVWMLSLENRYDYVNPYIQRYNITSATLTGELAIPNTNIYQPQLVDNNYAGSSYLYGMVYPNSNVAAKSLIFVSGSGSLVETTALTQVQLGYTGVDGPTSQTGYISGSAGVLSYVFTTLTGATRNHHAAYISTAGAWTNKGVKASGLAKDFKVAAFQSSSNAVVYSVLGSTGKAIEVIDADTGVEVQLLLLEDTDYVWNINNVNDELLFTTSLYGAIYKYIDSGNPPERIYDGSYSNYRRVDTRYHALTYLNGVYYGLDEGGRLYKLANTISPYIDNTDFSGRSVTDAWNAILNAYNLIGNISTSKRSLVYRRGDDSGNIESTGNTATLTTSNTAEITLNRRAYPRIDVAYVRGAEREAYYNGSTWNDNPLSITKRIEFNSDLIPDELVEDLAYYYYQFYQSSRDLYDVTTANVPLYQYEPFDAASITYTTTKIQKTASGIIYGVSHDVVGNTKLTILI